jgi:hypothetical protein
VTPPVIQRGSEFEATLIAIRVARFVIGSAEAALERAADGRDLSGDA